MDPKGIVMVLAMLFLFFNVPAPVINSIIPKAAMNNATVNVVIDGAKFDKNATVRLIRNGEEDIDATAVKVSSGNKINCSFDLKGKPVGSWDLVVTNKKVRKTSLPGGFTIGYPALQVSEVTPKHGYNNETVAIEIKGSAFRSGASVMLSNKQMDIGASKVQVVSETQITCEVNLHQAEPGVYNVKVVNDDGKTGALTNGFTVEGAPKPVVNVVKPEINAITPNKGFNNGMILTAIEGSHFEPGSMVRLSRNGQVEIPGLNIKVEEPTRISCFFDISGQPEGAFDVEVISPSGQKAVLANGFTVEKFVPALTELNKALKPIYFDLDKAEIRPNQLATLDANLAILKNYPELYIILGGHADERGGIEYNLELSARRAKAIKNYLAGKGIDPQRITIYAYGKEFPAAKGHNESSWWRNRRVETMVWGAPPANKDGAKGDINYIKLPGKK